MKNDLLLKWYNRALNANREAHQILSMHEQSNSRVIILEDLISKLRSLPIDVQTYFREATTCLEHDLRRSAIVLSWSGFFHVLIQKMYIDNEKELKSQRPKWKFSSLEELKENYVEHQLIDAARAVKLISKPNVKVYQGQLATRNKCAHPTLYNPSLNSALGFVDDMILQSIRYL